MSSQSASAYSSIGLRRLMPTLWTNTSSPPSRSAASAIRGARRAGVAQVGRDHALDRLAELAQPARIEIDDGDARARVEEPGHDRATERPGATGDQHAPAAEPQPVVIRHPAGAPGRPSPAPSAGAVSLNVFTYRERPPDA